jgi:deazaflavin-dependent oxidoreductase (nitroreductase family)
MPTYTSIVQRLGHQAWFATLGRWLVPVDRWLLRHTTGRWSVAGRHGLPSLLLTTTGRRSGQPRTQPLLYATDGDAFVVVGSNWGQQHHPAWSANLLAGPDATVTIDGTEIPVRGVHATGAERDRLWGIMQAVWPAYRTYQQRADGRDLRVFRLERR